MEQTKSVTNQIRLAEMAGCSPKHLCNGKKKKGAMSDELYAKLSEITGIAKSTWMVGDRRTLAKQLREFFVKQKGAAA